MKQSIFQIFYDEQSKGSISQNFIALDNTKNSRPDWYEFWPMMNYLNSNILDDNTWYGFLSPKFEIKSGFSSSFVVQVLDKYNDNFDVALFSGGWDQLSYFINPFEQGDMWHPGLQDLAQDFFNSINININLKTLVTYSSTSVFSNYIIAKKKYWIEWIKLANLFFEAVENKKISGITDTTSYGSILNQTPMKTFIQERFPSIILTQGGFNVLSFDRSQNLSIFERIFNTDISTRRHLQTCNLLKEKYCLTGDIEYLRMFYKVRGDILLKKP